VRNLEKTAVAALIIVSLIGVIAIYSSTKDRAGLSYALKQGLWIGLGFSLMLLVRRMRTRTLAAISFPTYILSLALLMLVLLIGTGPHGTKRWFDLGFLRFQPSELAKLSLVLMLAHYLSHQRSFSLATILKVYLVVLIPALLVLYEPDLGTAIVLGIIPFPMLYIAGLDWLHVVFLASPFIALACSSGPIPWIIFASLLIALVVFGRFRVWLVSFVLAINVGIYAVTPIIWQSLADYQRNRLHAFVKPGEYRFGAAFQTLQSKIAIGSGGVTGKGLFKGTQKALGLVPEQHTDFVFSVIGEELGLLGCLAVLVLLALLLNRLLVLASKLRSRFSIYFCYGLTLLILIQVFINVGMTLGIAPVTGLPLPFVSYGGSHMLMLWIGCGIVFAAYRRKLEY